jgi:hypothetical protein
MLERHDGGCTDGFRSGEMDMGKTRWYVQQMDHSVNGLQETYPSMMDHGDC